jgi:hypothetical protein
VPHYLLESPRYFDSVSGPTAVLPDVAYCGSLGGLEVRGRYVEDGHWDPVHRAIMDVSSRCEEVDVNAVNIVGIVLVYLAHEVVIERTLVVVSAEAFCYGHLFVGRDDYRAECPSMARSKT